MADTPSLDAEHRKLYRSHHNWYVSPLTAVLTTFKISSTEGVTADFANHKGIRRAWCLSITAVSFLISQLVGLWVQDIDHLHLAVALVGVSYGGVFGLLPTIIIEWFGMGAYDHFVC